MLKKMLLLVSLPIFLHAVLPEVQIEICKFIASDLITRDIFNKKLPELIDYATKINSNIQQLDDLKKELFALIEKKDELNNLSLSEMAFFINYYVKSQKFNASISQDVIQECEESKSPVMEMLCLILKKIRTNKRDITESLENLMLLQKALDDKVKFSKNFFIKFANEFSKNSGREGIKEDTMSGLSELQRSIASYKETIEPGPKFINLSIIIEKHINYFKSTLALYE